MSSDCGACCMKCGHRFTWRGQLCDRPPCPECGFKPGATDAVDAKIARQYNAGSTPILPGLEVSRDSRRTD